MSKISLTLKSFLKQLKTIFHVTNIGDAVSLKTVLNHSYKNYLIKKKMYKNNLKYFF